MTLRLPKQSILTFLLLLSLFSAAAYALVIHNHVETPALSRFLMWCPGFAALCTCLLFGIPLGSLGWRWPSLQPLRLAYFLPIIYATPVYVLVWFILPGSFALKRYEAAMVTGYGLQHWPAAGTFAVALPLLVTVSVIATMTWALGEELGWRGLLFPFLLQRFGFHRACLFSGLLWAVWHYPVLLWADYNASTNPVYAISCFTTGVVGMGYLMGCLRISSGSIWPCVLLHAAHNSFVEGIFDPLTASTGWAKYITTEFGAGVATSIVVAAMVVVKVPGSRKRSCF